MKNTLLAGSIAAGISTVFISSYSTFTKLLLEHFSTHSLAAISQIFSVITLMLFFGALPEFKKLGTLSNKQMVALILVGLLSAVIQPLFLFNGLLKTTAINGVLIGRSQMVIVGIISALWLKERVTPNQIVGAIIMFGGAYFIATKGLKVPITLKSGDTLLMVAAFFGALSTNVFKKYLAEVSPHLVVLIRNTLGVVLNLTIVPVILNFEHNFKPVFETKVLITVTLFSLMVIVGAQYLWYKAVEIIPANRASNIGMTSPLFGLLFAMTILSEKFTAYHMFGGALIISGLILTTFHHQSHPHHARHLKAKQWVH